MSVKVKFDTRDLITGLRNLSMTAEPAVAKVVEKNASELKRKEMRDVPVDTGFLKRSITLTTEDKGLTAIVEPTAHYARYLEYGTRYMAAQPYVRANYYEQAKQFVKEMGMFVK